MRRLGENFLDVRELIYATSQQIGPDADELVANLRRRKNIALDIRDRSWFTEREGTAAQRSVASEELAHKLVDPLLAERGLRDQVGVALSKHDARIAVLHLALDAQNEATSRGLTKASFETLVLAALHDTDANHRIPEPEVRRRVESMLPAGNEVQVQTLASGALKRLSGKRGRVKHHNGTDDYCLSHEEVLRVRERTTEYLVHEQTLEHELLSAVRLTGAFIANDESALSAVARDLRVGIESLLLRRGESFASVATSGVMELLDVSELLAIVAAAGRSPANQLSNEEATFAIFEVLNRPSTAVQEHLRRLSDAYTLMAFLQQTPDVQKVVLTMFSQGDIWLDSSVVLPLIAEMLTR